jgi:hypothetical protein
MDDTTRRNVVGGMFGARACAVVLTVGLVTLPVSAPVVAAVGFVAGVVGVTAGRIAWHNDYHWKDLNDKVI